MDGETDSFDAFRAMIWRTLNEAADAMQIHLAECEACRRRATCEMN